MCEREAARVAERDGETVVRKWSCFFFIYLTYIYPKKLLSWICGTYSYIYIFIAFIPEKLNFVFTVQTLDNHHHHNHLLLHLSGRIYAREPSSGLNIYFCNAKLSVLSFVYYYSYISRIFFCGLAWHCSWIKFYLSL